VSDLIIKIGDDPLDLSSGETIALTRQAAKVGDFVAVMADGTNEVTVPLTANNRSVLDNAHLIPTESILPYRRTDATMIQEGYETITNGYAIIKSSADNFSLQVVGGNGGFFDLIRNLNLRELSLSGYDHFWTNLHAFDNRNNTDGHIYAVFEQSDGVGVDSTMRTYGTNLYAVQTARLLPCFYAKTLIGKIFNEQGYTFVTDLLADDIYDKLVVFNGQPNRGDNMSHHLCTVTRNSATLFAAGYIFGDVVVTDGSTYTASTDFLTWLQTPSFKFKMTDPCTITVDFEIILFWTGTTAYSTTMRIDVERTTSSGVTVVSSNTETVNVGVIGDPDGVYNYTMTFDVGDFDGDIHFRPYNVVGFAVGYVMNTGTSVRVTSATMLANTGITTDFPFNFINGLVPVPDIKQPDFLKDMSRVFQWIYDVNELTKVVTARRFDAVVENVPTAIDLSDRIDTRKQKITYGIDGFAQTNSLAYKQDDITGYDAIGYIDVDDQTLKAESKYVEVSQFAATSTRKRFDTVDAPYVPIFDDEALPSNGVAHRLLLLERVTFPYNVNFNRAGDTPADYPTDDLTFAYFAKAGNPTSLDFPNLITRFYQTIMAMSLRGKTLECLMNLKISDVVNYNPFTPVYIQQHGSYFYWQKVSNYVKDKLTKCTFIRL
jgi:hypothetical protein